MVKQNIEKKTMELKTAHGTLIVQAFDNPDYPAFNIDFKLDGHENEPAVPVAIVEDAKDEHATDETNGHAVVVRVYGDCNDEEYTDRVDIPIDDIKEYIEGPKLICPVCHKSNTIHKWNKCSAEVFGHPLQPLTPEDIDDDHGISGYIGNYKFSCPECKAVVAAHELREEVG